MSTARNILFMGSSTGIRLAFGTLTSIVMARALGPEAFGLLMFWMAVSVLLSIIAGFGLATYLLREIGAAPQRANAVMCDVLSAKLLLSSIVVAIVAVSMPFMGSIDRWIFALLTTALLADSLTEYLNVGFRATNRFASETRVATIAAVTQFLIVALALFLHTSPVSAAAGFLLSRLAVVTLTWNAQRSYFSELRPSGLSAAVRCIRHCVSYGIDFFLQQLFGQVDNVLLKQLGDATVGVYGAGMRVFTGGAQAAAVLQNVFLPRAAAAATDPQRFSRESQLVQRVFIGVGASFGLIMAVFAVPLTSVLFGHRFAALAALFPWFGLLFFVRFFASSWGIILTSAGQQNFRAGANCLLWLVQLSLAALLIPKFGAVGWLMSLVCGHLMLSIIYLLRGIKTTPLCFRTLALTAVCALAFLPFVHIPQLGFES